MTPEGFDGNCTENQDLPTLYARDSKGRVKVWRISARYELGCAYLETSYGLQDGVQTTHNREVKGKNIGKSNETTPFQQACLEAESRWKKQLDKGYQETIPTEPESTKDLFLPMLAHPYEKRGHAIVWPACVQPKLDGFRCLARKQDGKVTLWTRRGKVIDTLEEIVRDLEALLQDGDCCDGELYKHEWRNSRDEVDFQRISRAIKKRNPDTPELEYHVYDIPVEGRGFMERFTGFRGTGQVKVVDTTSVGSYDEALAFYEECIGGDFPYEGIMVRNCDSHYKFGHRSADLQKIKPFQDEEYRIIGGREAEGHPGTVVFRCVTPEGFEFDCRPTGTTEQRTEYLTNLEHYTGQWLTVRFNGLTNDGVPRFPRGLRIRPEWDKGFA